MLGFKYVHIWVEPPKMGDEYIFFARSDQVGLMQLASPYPSRRIKHAMRMLSFLLCDEWFALLQQRKPMKREKLREWYKRMLDKAKDKGIVASYGSMQDLFGQMKSVRGFSARVWTREIRAFPSSSVVVAGA